MGAQGYVHSSRGGEKCLVLEYIFKAELRTLVNGLYVVNREKREVKEHAKVFGVNNPWKEVLFTELRI